MLVGKSASAGTAIGKSFIIHKEEIKIEEGFSTDTSREMSRLDNAVASAKAEIESLKDRVLSTLGADKAQIFEAHLMILEDPELTDAIAEKIKTEKLKATQAVHEVASMFISMFESMNQEYMRERALDVKDVTQRILRNLLGVASVDLATLKEPVILVAHDITPSQMASAKLDCVLGIVTEIGGKTSHTAIMARTLELPAVVGLKDATAAIRHGEILILDGEAGKVFPGPETILLQEYEIKRTKELALKKELQVFVGKKTLTVDGRQVHLIANIASALDLNSVNKNDAEGVGLFRTEFIYMDRTTAPSEDEQYEIYRKVLESLGDRPTVIRTLDVGGDKNISYLKIPKEENPFLGFRAIRYCLQNETVFKTQLRALLRSSVHGNLHIMFPMISNLQEILKAKALLKEAQLELVAKGIKMNTFKVGIMIEIPSAAVIADVLAKHVDFFSIGTNDLIQYICAVDRMNENVHELYDPFHPAVLRLINQVIKEGKKAGIEVGMCGEMAANEALCKVLLGMGLTHFSMAPSSILKTRKIISQFSYQEAINLADKVLQLGSGVEIRELLKAYS
jgi:phosphoenolpyruvate-protein phosphotransferase (PTS system enzyme I)